MSRRGTKTGGIKRKQTTTARPADALHHERAEELSEPAQHLTTRWRPATCRGMWKACTRYALSTIIYCRVRREMLRFEHKRPRRLQLRGLPAAALLPGPSRTPAWPNTCRTTVRNWAFSWALGLEAELPEPVRASGHSMFPARCRADSLVHYRRSGACSPV